MDHDDQHYERFKQELDRKYATWKQGRGMASSETPADKAPRYESFLESFGRAISEVTTVPAGPDSVDDLPGAKAGVKR